MRLIRLSANQPSFHEVIFKGGLNLVVGSQQRPDIKGTRNGLGKSLMVALIHFCLGSNSINGLQDRLPDWEFALQFEIGDKPYDVRRNTSDQKILYLNGAKVKLRDFCDTLGEEVFFLDGSTKSLTFRSLLSRFIRPRKSSYVDFAAPVAEETPYQRVLNVAYLLGLDTQLVQKKMELKTDLDNTKKLKEGISSDPVIKEYFAANENVGIGILDLQEKIGRLSGELEAFRIAENYHSLEEEADELAFSVRELENRTTLIKQSIQHITKSLSVDPDIDPSRVFALYKEASLAMPESVVRSVDQVVLFQKQLLESRATRLKKDRTLLQEELKRLEATRQNSARRLDETLHYLGTHGALEQYTSLRDQLESCRSNLDKLQEYENILEKYSGKQAETKMELAKQNVETAKYLSSARPRIDQTIKLFRSFSKEFYADKPGGIEITSNENENQIRFDVSAHIQDDSADGINEVKIFCFDMTLLSLASCHCMRSVIHDSRLFGDMDERQRATLFRVADQIVTKSDLQYIATANTDLLHPLHTYYSPDEYRRIIDDNTVLTLTDESPESKLLGIEIDLEYEK